MQKIVHIIEKFTMKMTSKQDINKNRCDRNTLINKIKKESKKLGKLRGGRYYVNNYLGVASENIESWPKGVQ